MLPNVSDPLSERILRRVLNAGERKVLGRLGSGQIAQSLNSKVNYATKQKASGRLNVPHYWIRRYHSGSPNTVIPTRAKILVWFRNPKNDPRLSGGRYPVRKSQVQKLGKEEFRKYSALNRKKVTAYLKSSGKKRSELTSTDYYRMNLPMIVAKMSPRNGKDVKSNPFFANEPGGGMYRFDVLAGNIAARETYDFVEERLRKSGLKNKTIVRSI